MDVELVVRARSGDREAFGQLAALSIARLDAAARLIIRDRERARDVVQETLVRVWRSRARGTTAATRTKAST